MISFEPPSLSDRCWATALAALEGPPLCDYSFPVLFCWQQTYGFQIARLDRRMLVRLESSRGPAYLWPVGDGDPTPALEALTREAHSQGHPLRLICLGQYHKNWLADRYPGRFAFAEVRDSFDYLYSVDRLAD
ncbi:MAG: phosphatidylglycerol lysyltransferase domain-containing protein, partial [Agathobaculum sp.]|uniref:phosphatidylglycerol lysyltransferase domain-containing protein n=1 Tax=Agathobaculum sp. TaxID=2048138 RepID=UPI0025C628B0